MSKTISLSDNQRNTILDAIKKDEAIKKQLAGLKNVADQDVADDTFSDVASTVATTILNRLFELFPVSEYSEQYEDGQLYDLAIDLHDGAYDNLKETNTDFSKFVESRGDSFLPMAGQEVSVAGFLWDCWEFIQETIDEQL